MTHLNHQMRLYGTVFVIGAGIFLLVATVTILLAAVQNWSFTTASNYTFDASKVEVSDELAKLKPITVVHDEAEEFTGTHSNTLWATDHIELDGTGLNTGTGSYTSQIIDSGMTEVEWGKITWTENLSQDSAGFSPTKSVGGISSGYSVYGTDIDGDDDVDVFSVQNKSPRTSYFENDGADTFASRTINNGQLKDSRDLQGADINNDGLPDLVVVAKSGLAWFENLGGSPVVWNKWDITPKPSGGLELEVADVNNNGSRDLIVGDETSLQWYESNGINPPSWTVHEVDNTLSAVDAVSAGDLDADGDLDLLAGGETGLYWYENNGATPPVFTRHELDNTVVNAESIITADFNNDGKLDIVGIGLGNLSLHWYQNDGAIPPNFTKRTIDSGPLTSPVSVAAGDLDRDGDEDLVLVDNADVHWYQNQGGALPTWTKSTLTTGDVFEGDHLFLVNLEDDFNGDDDLDILLAEKNQVSWWENLMPHSNLRFQLRTSADKTTWSPWQGTGGRATSSYTNPEGGTITVPNGRYIQYRVFLRTHNGTTLNPQLSMVRLEPAVTSYPTNNPTVQNVTGQDYSSISSFSETLGVSNRGQVKYQLSNDGNIWYYHNGSLWVPAAQGFNHSNSAAEVDAQIFTFPFDVGPGTFYFKAFLNSNGIDPVELDQVAVDLSTGGSAGGSGTGSSGSGTGSGGSQSGGGSEETPLNKLAWLSGTQTTNGTNINQGPAVALEWDSSAFDANYFSHSTVTSPERLTIKTDGDYLVAVTLPMSGTAARSAVQAEIWVNGTPADGAIGESSYIRNSSGHGESSDHLAVLLTNLAADDTVEVFVTRTAAVGTVNIDGQASLYAEFIGPTRTVFSATATQTTNSTNLNYTAAYALEWAEDRKDQGFTHSGTVNPENITVDEAGDYLVFVNIPLTGSLTRGNVRLLVQDDGVIVAGGEGKQGYIRNASGHNHSSIHWSGLITGVNAGSVLSIATQREGGSGTMTIPAGKTASLYIEKLDSGNNVYFARGNTLTGGNNWNPTTPQSIQWTHTDIIDSALFNHSPATNPHEIAIRRSGDYLLIYHDSLTAAGSRPNVRVTVEVNGSAKTGAETKSHYIRNASGHTESSGSLVFLLKDLAVNDVITVSTVREAGSPTVNDNQDALLMLWFKGDIAAPHLASATVNSRSLVLTYTDASGLDPTSTPDPTDFSVGTDGVSQTVTGVSLDATKVTLTLSSGVADVDSITVSYAVGANPIQDLMANAAFNLAGQLVANMTPRLVFVPQPRNGTSGWALDPPPVVEVRDDRGNPITVDPDSNIDETVTLTLNPGSSEEGATLSGNATNYVDWSTGRATFTNLTIDLVGSYQLTASTSFIASTTLSTEFSINPGPPAQLAYGVQPGNGVSTELLSPAIEVQVEDAAGNLVATATDPVTLALDNNPSNGSLSGTLTVSAVSGVAIFSAVFIDKAGSSYTIETAAYGLAPATSAGFDITVGSATKLVYVVEPNHAVSSEAVSPAIEVQIQDPGGNLVSTETAPITLLIKDNPGNGILSGTLTVQAVGGVATYQDISIDKKGNAYTLEASSSGLVSVISQGFKVVASDDPIQLTFSVQPSNAESEVALSPSITVQVLDAGGNLIKSATNPITLALKDNPSNGILSGTLTAMAQAGEVTFSDLSVDKAGDGYSLVASATGLNSATSEGFNIRPGDAFQLAFVVHPENGQSQKTISPPIKVQVQDAAGNRVVRSTDLITLAIEDNPGHGTLSGTLAETTKGGEVSFSNISLDRAGDGYRLVASAAGLEFVMSDRFNIQAGEATQLAFIGQPGNGASQETLSPAIKVQIRDAAGNLVDTSTVSIHLAIQNNPGGGTLSGTLMVLPDAGEGTFDAISIDKIGGNYALVASASGLSPVTSGNFNIETGKATQLVFAVHPVDTVGEAVISPAIKVQVQDAGGNLVTTATDSILLLMNENPGGGTLAGTLKVNAKGGEGVFDSVSIDKAATGYSLLASASGLISRGSQAFAITENEKTVTDGGRAVFVSMSGRDFEVVVESANEGKEDDSREGIQGQEIPVIADQVDGPVSDSGPEVVNPSPANTEVSVIRDDSRAGLLNRETVVVGKSITIRYRAASGLSPKIDVYDARRVRQISADPMREIGTTGVYEYHLTLESGWGLGDFTIIASESEKGTLNWMTLTVVETRGADITLVKTDAITVLALLTAVQTKLDSVQTNLNNANETSKWAPGHDLGDSEVNPRNLDLDRIHAAMRDISKLLKPVSTHNGIDLDHYYRSINEPTADVDKLREKAEQLRILLEVNRELVGEGPKEGVKEPVTKTWFESGSVILKILVVNPSQTETQTIPVKIYLPKEVAPEDIINLEDLELDYDPEKGMYYAHKEVELGPGQSITKMVRMEDIWVYPEERLTTFVNQATEISDELGRTAFAEEGAAFLLAIESKVQEILETQKKTVSNAAAHIQAYRQATTLIFSIKNDLSALDQYRQRAVQVHSEGESAIAEGSQSKVEAANETPSEDLGNEENESE